MAAGAMFVQDGRHVGESNLAAAKKGRSTSERHACGQKEFPSHTDRDYTVSCTTPAVWVRVPVQPITIWIFQTIRWTTCRTPIQSSCNCSAAIAQPVRE